MYVKNGTARLKRVLLSPPDFLRPAPINEIAKKWESTELDPDKMRAEYENLKRIYRECDVKMEELSSDRQRPNSVFSRDFGGCVKEGYILGKFKYKLREKEHTDYKQKMQELEIPMIAQVQDGLFEGGDFLFLDEKNIVIGNGERSNKTGISEIREQLIPYGYQVHELPIPIEYLHLDMCFNLVTDHVAVCYPGFLSSQWKEFFYKKEIEFIEVEEKDIYLHGCNLQALGDNRVLSLKSNEIVNEKMDRKGIKVFTADMEEILKAGGGPHCMTFPLERI